MRNILAVLLTVCGTALSADAPVATLTVSGDIPAILTLTSADLAKMPRETVTLREQDGEALTYEGVPVREILKKAGAPTGKDLRGKALASYVIAKAKDGYSVVFAIAELDPAFTDAKVIVADLRDGKPLFGYQGPLRIVAGGDKRPARSVRMLERLEFVRLQK